jgi:hypothetical protein
VNLSDWSQNGWLLPHRTSSQEIADLFAVVERDLADSAAIPSLRFTIGAPPTLVGRFDAFRKKRNIGGYERAGLISDGEAQEMQDLARSLREAVREWLKSKHAALLPRGGKPTQNR